MRWLPPLLLLLVLAAPPAAAASYPDPQKAPVYYDSPCIAQYDRRFVYDFQFDLLPSHAKLVENAACDLYTNTSAHFVLVTVNDTGGEILENYALHLFQTWGIGQKDKNDGVLLLYVEHYNLSGRSAAVRLEVGYGLEGAINGHASAEIVRDMQAAKKDALDNGSTTDYAVSVALATGAYDVLSTLDANYQDGSFPAPNPASSSPPISFFVIVIAFFVVLVLLNAARRRSWGYYAGSPAWGTGMGRVWSGGGGSWGGGAGGFGGGGFGGGRSGGGGGSGGL